MTKILRSQHPKYIFFRKNSDSLKKPYFPLVSEGEKYDLKPVFLFKSTHGLLNSQMADDSKCKTKHKGNSISVFYPLHDAAGIEHPGDRLMRQIDWICGITKTIKRHWA